MSIKFPRIYHVPSSPKKGCDDKVADSDYFRYLKGQDVVLTSKMDGGNTCVTMEGLVFARSHGQVTDDASFDYLKSQVHRWVAVLMSRGLDMYGENLYHIHTVIYTKLPSWFFVIGFRFRETGLWLPWDEVVVISQQLGLPTVPVLYRGIFADQKTLEAQIVEQSKKVLFGEKYAEGVVVRRTVAFYDAQFADMVFKWVSDSFVIEGGHWRNKERKINSLAK